MSIKTTAISPTQAPKAAPSLSEAIKGWDQTDLPDYGKNVGVQTFAKMSLQAAISEATGSKFEDRAGFEEAFASMHGAKTPAALAGIMREMGRQAVADAETPAQGKKQQHAFNAVADAVEHTFGAGFTQLTLLEHMVSEDGDVEQRLLAGQKKDGSWTIFEYSDFPF